MELLITFIITLAVFAGVVLLAGLGAFAVVWIIFAIRDNRRQAKIRRDWGNSA